MRWRGIRHGSSLASNQRVSAPRSHGFQTPGRTACHFGDLPQGVKVGTSNRPECTGASAQVRPTSAYMSELAVIRDMARKAAARRRVDHALNGLWFGMLWGTGLWLA